MNLTMAGHTSNARYLPLLWAGAVFLWISFLVRAGLTWYEGGLGQYGGLLAWTQIFSVGLLYDLAAFVWLMIPFSLVAWLCTSGVWGRRINALLTLLLFVLFLGALIFQSASEFIFWNEFSSRFNFIAVDYLVYTREVVGNIQQSYPVGMILAGIAALTIGLLVLLARPVWQEASLPSPGFFRRSQIFFASLLLPTVVFMGLGEQPHQWIQGAAVRELASNGLYSLFRAYRNNELSYAQYYATFSNDQVAKELAEEMRESHAVYQPVVMGSPNDENRDQDVVARHIPAFGATLKRNVVLVSIESLGSDYVDAFGGKRGLTPNLDALAQDSLIFTNLYATGLRTVRGLEALTLSVPPTPGRAVPMRERNKNLQTLGEVFRNQGYEPIYLYGGYSWFDNMQDFFGGNGYTVIDRQAIPDQDISHETIWGVADEDLYQLALRELDQRAAKHTPFFAHIMTTSNHRPYTYPKGRVSIPSHTSRSGAVQYTDWAIGQFMAEVKQRSWYENTIFVFIADHTSHGRGRIDLPPENYRIPMLIHAPKLVQPGKVDYVASQIDVAPTLLGLLNIEYDSHFFGQDILHEAEFHQRAFMANYLTVGYMEDGRIVELGPKQFVRVVDAKSGDELSLNDAGNQHLVNEAIAYYQAASSYIEGHALSNMEMALPIQNHPH